MPALLEGLKKGLAAKNFQAVLEGAERLLGVHGDRPGLLSLAAAASFGLKLYPKAKDFLLRALKISPNSPQLQVSLAKVDKKLDG